jgi:cobalt/nickel transport system ATP-binding protein
MEYILKVKDLAYDYPGGIPALSGVSFSLARGERLAIVGGNGAGKTTLLLHMNGILEGDGTVEVAGMRIGDSQPAEIRRRVGMLFADPDDQLFMPTVIEDVAFGLLNAGLDRAVAKQKAIDALEALSASHLAQREPRRLSRGEKKRAALAAVLALEPEILVMDEPASGLDPVGRREFIRTINGLDSSMIIATHDLELALEVCNRAIVLNGGSAVAEGATRELLLDEGLMLANDLEVPASLRF